jgi:branched-chain amino acid transport system permease protein
MTGENRAVLGRLSSRLPAAGLVAAFVALAAVPLFLQAYAVGEWTFALAFGVAAVGLNILIADAGLVSLGHNAFVAFGAYAAAWFAGRGMPYWQSFFVVAALALALGWVVGAPVVKLGHLNFALVTIGIGFVAPTLALRLVGLTGGADGESLPAMNAPAWTGLTGTAWLYYVGLAVFLGCVLISIGLRRGQVGRALLAQRDNEAAAEAFGVRLWRIRCGVFALSVMMCGISGWLWGITASFVAPDSFDATLSISLLAGVVMGGLGFAATPIVAGIFVEFVPNISSNISPAFDGLVEGCIIVIIMLVARKGLFGLLQSALGKLSGSPPAELADIASPGGAEAATVAVDRSRPAIAPQERA